ncbi:HdeD family acid-resistance protein [Nocardioides iriomotensis]|uniref:HdeD family acid-resistance protein n=1 Tax=Nocardioides iriomotensis TaxID=715784 RepID=A0A4Q5J3F5_9ACTN|nr:DUF308 domain-containing protein [Nocardioides iriomotensis]RYU12923.1 hypothetical protein ETU37_08185 [Nocardioides iriomotensis]
MTADVRTMEEPTGALRDSTWALVLIAGIVTAACGLALAFWPEETLRIVAVIVAVQLLLTGLVSVVGAVAAGSVDRGVRTLVVLSGILSILVGLVLLRAPQQTVVVVALLLGLYWVLKGLVELVAALTTDASPHRWWSVAIALFTTAVGTFLVLRPEASFALLVIVVQVWLLGYGFIMIVSALSMRSAARRAGS